jgi:hypothetical protein
MSYSHAYYDYYILSSLLLTWVEETVGAIIIYSTDHLIKMENKPQLEINPKE